MKKLEHDRDVFSLAGRIALITGASSGIGRHMAGVLARRGAKVVAIARRRDALDALAAEHPGHITPLVVDLGSADGLPAQFARDAASPFGAPDILINAAGANPRAPADTVDLATFEATLRLNLTMPMMVAQSLVPGMREKGYGNILNIASLQSYRAFTNGIAYGASKGGITQLTRAMAEAWGRHGIVANAIAPGFFPTELTAPVFADETTATHHARATCIGRNGQLADLDGATVFLCSRAAAYVTGQVLAVDGGYLAK